MKRALRLFGYLIIFAALAAGSAYGTYRIMITRMTVEVPDLSGMSRAEADSALATRGLYLKVAGEDNDLQVPVGHILSQDIAPGEKIRGMAEIKVVLSKGPAVKLIPDVVGQKASDAQKLFTQKGLEVKIAKVHSDTTEDGTVIAQWPSPDEWNGQNITLVASEGPYEVSYYCPSFVGLLKEDALSLAQELDLKVDITEEETGGVMVASQEPLPGEPIDSGSTLHLQLKGVDND